jgi:hypothetical protein
MSVDPPERDDDEMRAVDEALTTIRTHLALAPDEVLHWYLACAAAQVALRHDKLPDEALREMLEQGVLSWDDPEQQRKALREFTLVARSRFVGAIVQFVQADPSRN